MQYFVVTHRAPDHKAGKLKTILAAQPLPICPCSICSILHEDKGTRTQLLREKEKGESSARHISINITTRKCKWKAVIDGRLEGLLNSI
eukprot:scaffold77138_cov15-Tisochrysis_lutea.AAC.1